MGHRDRTHQSHQPEAAMLPSVAFPRRVPLHVVRQQPLPKRPINIVDADPDVVAINPVIHMIVDVTSATLPRGFNGFLANNTSPFYPFCKSLFRPSSVIFDNDTLGEACVVSGAD